MVPEAGLSGEARSVQRRGSRLTETHRAESLRQWVMLPQVMRESLDRATWDIAWQVASSALREAATEKLRDDDEQAEPSKQTGDQ